ncbi:MAG TPA: hypothetical protein VGB08_04965 [Allosphingosinicella sp.]|jgi:hypothetical protein
MSLRLVFPAALLLFVGGAASAQDRPAERPRPEVMTRVVQCRAITGSAERLACFDREVAAMDAAAASGNLVAMDRQQVRRTRRSLFGLALPNLDVFGDDGQGDEEAARLEGTVRSASQNANGRWIIVLDDGARWIQTDTRTLGIPPRAGQTIRIRRASLGSYFANISNQTAIRMRRLN